MDQVLGEIRLVAFSRVPVGWHLCDGSLLQISDYQQLFSLIGTIYGGDGRTTFGIPDLRGRTVAGFGQGTGLPSYTLGQMVGSETTYLTQANLPAHTHTMASNSTAGSGTLNSPMNAVPAVGPISQGTGQPVNTRYAASPTPGAVMDSAMIGLAGNSVGIDNVQPMLVLNYIIALQGLYVPQPNG